MPESDRREYVIDEQTRCGCCGDRVIRLIGIGSTLLVVFDPLGRKVPHVCPAADVERWTEKNHRDLSARVATVARIVATRERMSETEIDRAVVHDFALFRDQGDLVPPEVARNDHMPDWPEIPGEDEENDESAGRFP
jgi:hypothetical protein